MFSQSDVSDFIPARLRGLTTTYGEGKAKVSYPGKGLPYLFYLKGFKQRGKFIEVTGKDWKTHPSLPTVIYCSEHIIF